MSQPVPFWEDPKNGHCFKDPQIIRGLNLVWWFFILNAIPRDIRNRLRTHVEQRMEALDQQHGSNPYWQRCGLRDDCNEFLNGEFSQDFWS